MALYPRLSFRSTSGQTIESVLFFQTAGLSRVSGLAATDTGVGLFVAQMLFRVLKFRPGERKTQPEVGKPYPPRPAINGDTAFFWEGVSQGELRIQSCADCGELWHPPGPVCPSCRSVNRTHVVVSGEGGVYSFVVHHPPVPGREAPFVVAVVELPEGVRIVGGVVDCPLEKWVSVCRYM